MLALWLPVRDPSAPAWLAAADGGADGGGARGGGVAVHLQQTAHKEKQTVTPDLL